MSETPIFGFRLVGVNTTESGKAASANENALIAEALFKGRVESRSTTTPPVSPANADVYIVPDTGATGAWVGHDNEVTIFYNGWLFVQPVNGPTFYVADEDLSVKYDDTASPPAWVVGGAGTFIGLSDTPANYSGQAGKAAVVNVGETGLEFGAAGGAGSWALISEHDFTATPAVELIVTGIDAYSELLVVASDLNAASLSFVKAHFSTDGGSTWLTTAGDYHRQAMAHAGVDLGGNNDEAFLLNGIAVAAGGHAVFSVRAMGLGTMFTNWNGQSANNSGNNVVEGGFAAVAAVHDALRLRHDNATNLNAGVIKVVAR